MMSNKGIKRFVNKFKVKNNVKMTSPSYQWSDSPVKYSPVLNLPRDAIYRAPSITLDEWSKTMPAPSVGAAYPESNPIFSIGEYPESNPIFSIGEYPESNPIYSEPFIDERDKKYLAKWKDYIPYLWKSMMSKNGDPDAKREGRIIFYEVLRHVDFLNDGLLLIRAYSNGLVKPTRTVISACILLTGVYIASWVGYLLRGSIIYNRLPSNSRVFYPILTFEALKELQGTEGRDALIMYERLQWTFVVISRIVEDFPQLVIVACLLGDNYDNYFIFAIAFSILIFALSSFRIGMAFPFKSSIKLMLRKNPEVHRDDVEGAAPLQIDFGLYATMVSAIGATVNLACAYIYKDHMIKGLLYTLNAVILGSIGCGCYFYWVYLTRESKDILEKVRNLPEVQYSSLESENTVPEQYKTSI